MDDLRKELGIERRIVVSESIELSRQSVQGLLEAITTAYRSAKSKPVRLFYEKGEKLVVERLMPESSLNKDNPFLTAYQMVRQHAEVEIIEKDLDAMATVCAAATALAEKDITATMLVSGTRDSVDKWFTYGKIDAIFRLPFLEDPDCPEGFLFFCGSQSGKMVGQIEYAVACRMED